MFWQTFQSTFLATFQVLLLGVSGYVLVKRRILDEHGLEQISSLTINFLLPLFSYYQLTTHFSFTTYPQWWIFPLVSVAMAFAGILFGSLLFLGIKDEKQKRELISLVAFQNSGNIPLTVVMALFAGQLMHDLYIQILLFVIGTNITVWTLGVRLMRGTAKIRLAGVFNPPFLAIIGALVAVATGVHRFVPQVVLRPIHLFGDCALPLAMLVVGGNLALLSFEKMDKNSLAVAVLAKLILFPLLALGIIWWLRPEQHLGFVIMIEAAVPSAATLSLICRYYNVEGKVVNQGLLFSHLLSVLTLPIFLTLYMEMAKGF